MPERPSHRASLSIPDRLYGRETQRALLLESFTRVARGQAEVLLVPGPSGIGKAALVEQLRAPVLENNGFFLVGKFSQYQQGVPYLALRQALACLARELTAEVGAATDWSARLQTAVGDHGRLLTDLAPELKPLLGEPPPPPEIGAWEARHRFAALVRGFLGALCQPEHPLVLFSDDWQWADEASLALLEQLRIGTALRYLLLIVAYRDDEINEDHPFQATLRTLQSQQTPMTTLPLGALDLTAQQAFLRDALQPALAEPAELARIMDRHTQGNPFFMRAFLDAVYRMGLLVFDPERATWRWSVADFDAIAVTGDVMEFLAHRFRQLPAERRLLLARAACLGNRFELADIALLSGRSPSECLALLREEIAAGLLLSDSDEDQADHRGSRRYLAFVHDRVQQAAYRLLDADALPATKLEIGRTLLRELPPAALNERLFELAELLNAGQHLIVEQAEKLRLLQLNRAAARAARAATAYRSALRYHRAAAELFKQAEFADWIWQAHHGSALDLLQGWSESEYLEGNHDLAEQLLRQAAQRAGGALERAAALNALIVQHTLQARYAKAIAAGREALAALGVVLPESDYEAARDAEIAGVRAALGERPIATLAEQPIMTDPTQRMIGTLLIAMGPPCYRADQHLWSIIVPMVVNLTLRHGNLPQIAYSHPAFAGLLIWVADDFATARAFSALAEHLMTETFESGSDRSVFRLMIGSSARFWFEHLERSTADYAEAYTIGLKAGNLQYAAYAFGHSMYCSFYQGMDLASLRETTERSLAFSRGRFNQWAIDLLEGGLLMIDALTGDEQDAAAENRYLDLVQAHENPQVLCIYRILKSFVLLLLGRHKEALAWSDTAMPMLHMVGTQGLLPWPMHLGARFLILSTLYPWVDAARQHQWDAELRMLLPRLRRWGEQSPANFAMIARLAEAELARLHGDAPLAMRNYVETMGLAQAGRFTHWEGLIAERAAWFWESQGNDRVAQGCWLQAYDCFARWGAPVKLRAMEMHYREWISARLPPVGDDPHITRIRRAVVERQISVLRLQSAKTRETSRRSSAERQAAELAEATARLREEVARRKAMEAELRESEARFRLTFDESPVGAGIVSLDLRYQRANAALCRFLGYSEARMRRLGVEDITHPEDIPETRRLTTRLRTGEIAEIHLDKRYLRADGTTVWGRLSVRLIRNAEGEPLYFLSLIEDISTVKATEQALRRAGEEARAASRAKSEFLANMSHEIRTPLNGVIGMLQLLEESSLSAEQADSINIAMKCSKRLEALLTDILDLSRIEAGKLTLKPAPFALAQLRDAVLDIFGLAAANKGLRLEVRIAGEAPERVVADELRLRQVLLNLVGNAIKYTEQGKVTIQITAQPATDAGPARIRFEVRDSGLGIPAEELELVFQPFFQSAPERGLVAQGAGLGLAIVRRLLALMDGRIEVESTLGQGTRVIFSVPLQAVGPDATSPSVSPEQQPRESAINGRALRLLIVDDEPTNLLVARRLLEKSGHRTHCASDGEEALAALRAEPFDCVLLDVQMPGMDGLATTRAIRAGQAGAARTRIPIVAMTAHAMSGDAERFLANGMDAYAAKPIDRRALLELLAQLCPTP